MILTIIYYLTTELTTVLAKEIKSVDKKFQKIIILYFLKKLNIKYEIFKRNTR